MIQLGIKLPLRMVLDNPGVNSLVDYIVDIMEREISMDEDLQSKVLREPEPLNARELPTAFLELIRSERESDGLDLLRAAARLRTGFDGGSESLPEFRTTCNQSDSDQVQIVFLAAPILNASPRQYSSIVKIYDGRRRVTCVGLPGFLDGESIPVSLSAAVRAISGVVRDVVQGEEFILAGYSSGGILAHAVAAEMSAGDRPSGILMLDSFVPSENFPIAQLIGEMIDQGGDRVPDSTRLTATIRWIDVLGEYSCDPLDMNIFFIQCGEPAIFRAPDSEPLLASPWPDSKHLHTVDSNHFSVLSEGAKKVVSAIGEWESLT